MTFLPVLPGYVLAALGALVVIVRVVTLYRLLVRTPAGRYRWVVLRWAGLTFAALLLVLAAFRPGVPVEGDRQASASQEYVSDVNVFLVVDRSVTSRIADFGEGQPRMVGIRDDIEALIDQYRGARFDLIGFATKAGVDWPISADAWSFKAYVKNLSAYALTPYDAVNFVDPTAARDVLRGQLEQAKQLYPDSKNVVFYLGDGMTGTVAKPTTFDVPPELMAGAVVLGYGTPAGGPIPASFAAGHKQYLGDPATGTVLTSGLDEGRLKEIATNLGADYFHREAGQDIVPVLPAVNQELMTDAADVGKADRPVGRTEWYWTFALLAAALLLVEVVLTVREYRRNRLSRNDFTAQDVLR
jgi:Ca-activated chloride channel homolog